MKKKTQLNEVRQLQKIAGILKEDQSDMEGSSSFTIIDSYSSRNDVYDYDFAYITSTDPRSSLLKYLVTEKGYSQEEAEDYISEIETRFEHAKRGKIEMWATDDQFFVVVRGEIDNEKMEAILRKI